MGECLIKRNSGSSNSKAKERVSKVISCHEPGGQLINMMGYVQACAAYESEAIPNSIRCDSLTLIGYDTDTYTINGGNVTCIKFDHLYYLTYVSVENSNELTLESARSSWLYPSDNDTHSSNNQMCVEKTSFAFNELGFNTLKSGDMQSDGLGVYVYPTGSFTTGSIKFISAIMTYSYESK